MENVMETDIIKKKKEQLKRSKRKERLTAFALISPYLIIFVLFTFIPVVLGIAFSFMKYDPHGGVEAEFVGFKNFANLFNMDLPVAKQFWSSFTTMLVFDIVAVPVMTIIPLVLAYFLNMNPPGYKIYRALIYLPSVVSISIVGIIFGNIFQGDEYGLINAILGTKIEWLSGLPWAGDTLRWLVMLIASIWWQTGTNFVIFSGALRNVPKSLMEACEMDGGSRFHKIMYVVFPSIKSALSICVFNTLIGYLGLYGQPYVLKVIENQQELVSPMMWIQFYLNDPAFSAQTGFICAAAIIFGLITMVFGIVQRVVMNERRAKSVHTVACTQFIGSKGSYNVPVKPISKEANL